MHTIIGFERGEHGNTTLPVFADDGPPNHYHTVFFSLQEAVLPETFPHPKLLPGPSQTQG